MNTKDFVTSFRKEFGEDSIFLLGEDETLTDIKVRSSGSLLLDLAMGVGLLKVDYLFSLVVRKVEKQH